MEAASGFFAVLEKTSHSSSLQINDGCLIAHSDEVKDLGYKLGASYFKVGKKPASGGVIVQSRNYALYCDLSKRVMGCLKELAPIVTV